MCLVLCGAQLCHPFPLQALPIRLPSGNPSHAGTKKIATPLLLWPSQLRAPPFFPSSDQLPSLTELNGGLIRSIMYYLPVAAILKANQSCHAIRRTAADYEMWRTLLMRGKISSPVQI